MSAQHRRNNAFPKLSARPARGRRGVTHLLSDTRGLSTVEYVIILVLIAAVCVATWSAFGGKVKSWLGFGVDTIGHEIDGTDVGELNGGGDTPTGGGGANPGGGGANPGGGGETPEPPRVKRKIKGTTEGG